MFRENINNMIIVQARMGSSRLPKKMKMLLGCDEVLAWVLKRARLAKEAQIVVLAIPDTPENDELELLAKSNGIDVYRGSEKDVLERITLSARKYQPNSIVRLCADRPFVDPQVIDETIRFYNKNIDNGSLVNLVFSHQASAEEWWPFGFGVEVFSYSQLEWLNSNVKNEIEREHVTLHMWKRPEKYKILPLKCPQIYSKLGANYKLDLDNYDDLIRLQRLVISSEDIKLPGSIFVERERNYLLNENIGILGE